MNEKGLLLYEIEECQKKLDNIILKENKNKVVKNEYSELDDEL